MSARRRRRKSGREALSDWLTANFPDADRWDHQDPSGSSVLEASYTTALALGRNVAERLFADYNVLPEWTNPSGEIARCDGSQAATSQYFYNPTLDFAGKTAQFTFTISNYFSGTIRPRIQSAVGAAESGDGTYVQQFPTISGSTTVGFTASDDFIGDINLATVSVQQTDIAASNTYPGAQLLAAAGTGVMDKVNWTSSSGAVLTNPSTGILRVATAGGDNLAQARQDVLTVGDRVNVSGEVRVESGATAAVFLGLGNSVGLGAPATFTEFVVKGIVTTDGNVYLGTSGVNKYVEWRNISITVVNPMNGDTVVAQVGVPTNFGSLGLSVVHDAAASNSNISSAEFNSKWDKENVFLGIWFNPDTLGSDKVLFRVGFDANNWIDMYTNDGSHVTARYRVGGVDKEVELAASTGEWGFYAVRYTGGSFNGLKNGVAGTPVVAAVIDLNIDEFIIGAATSAPTLVVDGDETRVIVAYENITDAQALSLYNQGRR